MATNVRKIDNLDVPFKEFMPGQIIQSGQFNDDMKDIEDKVNEIIVEQNTLVDEVNAHTDNFENPHQVTAHQTGTYTSQEIDRFVEDIKSGNLHDNAIGNRVLDDDCVSTRNILDGSVTSSKLDDSVGSQIDISTNVSIKDRYTKEETDAIIQEKVGSGTYDKATIDEKLEQIQAGQILDKSISIHQLKDDVGRRLDISNNPDIINKYTREEVDLLIRNNALPRDWGSILEGDDDTPVEIPTREITLPVANHMKVGTFTVSESSILDIDIQENVDARGEFNTVGERLDSVDSQIKEKATKYEVDVCDFGCVGDGITDDSEALQKAIDYAIANNLSIVSPKNKIYAVSVPIKLLQSNDILQLNFNKATIKAIADMDYVLSYNCVDGINDGGIIENLYVDANEKAKECIRFIYTRKTNVINCVMKNAKDKYIHVVGGNILVNGLYLDKRLYNYPNTTGIYISPTATDSKLNRIYMRDIKNAVVIDGGSVFLHQVHAYMLKKELIKGSVFMTINQNVTISDCYADTYNIGFKINNGFVQMDNTFLWINYEFYNDNTCTAIPKVFEFANVDRLKALLINNCYFRFFEYYQTTGKYGEFSNLDHTNLYYKSLVELQRNNYFSHCSKLPICSFRGFTLYNIKSDSYEVYQNDISVNGFNITISLNFKFKTNFTQGVEFSLGSLPVKAKYGQYSFLGIIYNNTTSYPQPVSITSNHTTNSIMKFTPVNSDCANFRCCITIPLRIIDSEETLLSYDNRNINN